MLTHAQEMPVMDGLTAIRRLRQIEARRGDEGRPRLPVIACTGNARQEQVDKCLQAGFDAVVVRRSGRPMPSLLTRVRRSSLIRSISSSPSSARPFSAISTLR